MNEKYQNLKEVFCMPDKTIKSSRKIEEIENIEFTNPELYPILNRFLSLNKQSNSKGQQSQSINVDQLINKLYQLENLIEYSNDLSQSDYKLIHFQMENLKNDFMKQCNLNSQSQQNQKLSTSSQDNYTEEEETQNHIENNFE